MTTFRRWDDQGRPRGRVWFAASVADPANPLLSELTVELTCEIAGDFAWPLSTPTRPIRRWGQRTVVSRPTERTVGETLLVLLEHLGTNTLMTTLARGVTGALVLFPQGYADGIGPAVGDVVEVRPGESCGPVREITMEEVSAHWTVLWAPTAPPVTEAVLS